MLLGHLALPALLKHYLQGDAPPLYAGSLFPDIVDKSLHLLAIAPNGRTIAHTLFTLTLSTTLVHAIWGKATARSWALGYLSHLIADMGSDVPWFYPLAAYEFKPSPSNLWQKLRRALRNTGLVEWSLLVWAVAVRLRDT